MLVRNIEIETAMKHSSKQAGFTLIEILIALIVVAVGFLGLASLQANGVKQTQNTYFRTQADLIARDLADRMRANPLGVRDGDYIWNGGVPGAASCDGVGVACDSATMAAADLSEAFQWLQAASLPNGDFAISDAPGGLPYIQVTVFWDEVREGAAGRGCDPFDANDMTCLILNVDSDNVTQARRTAP